jgi:regulatory protein
MKKLKSKLSLKEVKVKMASYCAYQDRCLHEIKEKLTDFEITTKEEDEIIDFLLQEKYWDEERFAESFVRGKIRHNHWGKIKVKYELTQRGVPNSIIQKALQSVEQEEYMQILGKVLETKSVNLREEDKWQKRQKLIQYALQKGFESNLVMEIIDVIEHKE